jgi:hypothetical protein
VTWFHVDSTNLVHRVDFKYKSDSVSYMAPSLESIMTFGKRIEECTSAVVVLDGAKGTDMFKNILLPGVRLWAGKKRGERTAVLISSGAVPEVRTEDVNVNSEIINTVFQNWSWTCEEYVHAFKRARSESKSKLLQAPWLERLTWMMKSWQISMTSTSMQEAALAISLASQLSR